MKSEVEKLFDGIEWQANRIYGDQVCTDAIKKAVAQLREKFSVLNRAVIDRVQPRGHLIVSMDEHLQNVQVSFHNLDWWVQFTPNEARSFAALLAKKADDLEADRRAAGEN